MESSAGSSRKRKSFVPSPKEDDKRRQAAKEAEESWQKQLNPKKNVKPAKPRLAAVLPIDFLDMKRPSEHHGTDKAAKENYKAGFAVMPTFSRFHPPGTRFEVDADEPPSYSYEVERILLKSSITKELLIKWVGYHVHESTWQSKDHLLSCDYVMKAFEDRQKLCSQIYASLSNKEEYQGFADTWEKGFVSRAFTEAYLIEEIFQRFNKLNKLGDIYVENWCRIGSFFPKIMLLAENIFSARARAVLDWNDVPRNTCTCEKCKPNGSCPCLMVTTTTNGFLRRFNSPYVQECHHSCKCSERCTGKLFLHGRKTPVMVFKTANCGWGLRTMVAIPVNKFVIEYIGLVKLHSECADIDDDTYLFNVDAVAVEFVIDATEHGNESRFINHSCDPNLLVTISKGFYSHQSYARIVFFSSRHIEAGEELTFNYFGHEPDKSAVGRSTPLCRCGSVNCRKYLI